MQPPLHLVCDIPRILQLYGINVLQADAVSPQLVDVAVSGDRDEPCAEGRAAAGIKPLNASDHFQKGLLRQVLAERFVLRSFPKEAGNIVIVQPDQLVERLPVAALTAFDQGLFIHRFLLLLGFISLHAGAAKRLVQMILVCRNIIFCRTEEYKKENGLPPKTAAPGIISRRRSEYTLP